MKKLILGALIALLPLTGSAAMILGFQVGGGIWSHDPSGSVSTSLDVVGVSADLKDDLKLSNEEEGYTYFTFEHPVPVIPNFKYVNTNLTSTGNSGTAIFTYNNTPISGGVDTALDLNQTDYILYYEILDNVISVDIGLNAKVIEGQVVVDNIVDNLSVTIPMAYIAAEIILPSDLTLQAEVSTLSISDAGIQVMDMSAKIRYTTDFMLGIEAGLRSQSFKIDTDGIQANIEFSGVFAGLYYEF